MTAYRVIIVQATVDLADDESYEQATDRVQAALDAACPEGVGGAC